MSFPWSGFALLTLVVAQAGQGAEPRRFAHGAAVYAVAFSPDGKTLISGGNDSYLRVRDVSSGRELRSWKAHDRGVLVLALSGDGRTLASGGRDGMVRLWDPHTGKEKQHLPGFKGDVESLALSRDGRIVAANSGGRTLQFRTLHEGLQFT